MSGIMRVALPVVAIAAAAYTGGTSLGLIGAGEGAAEAGSLESIVGAGVAEDAGMADSMATGSSWFGSTIASISPYVKAAGAIGTVISAGAQIAGIAGQAYGAKEAGNAAQTQADYEAQQLRDNANSEMGASEIQMQQQNRETAFVLSNAAAAAAAGGGSVTDPTVQTNMKTIAGEGRLRALTDMYNGQSKAQADLNKAQAVQYGGALTQQADTTKEYTSILSGGSSLYDKYFSDTYND